MAGLAPNPPGGSPSLGTRQKLASARFGAGQELGWLIQRFLCHLPRTMGIKVQLGPFRLSHRQGRPGGAGSPGSRFELGFVQMLGGVGLAPSPALDMAGRRNGGFGGRCQGREQTSGRAAIRKELGFSMSLPVSPKGLPLSGVQAARTR